MLGILPLPSHARRQEGCDARHAVRAAHGRDEAAIEFESLGRRGRERHGARVPGDAREVRVVVHWKHLDDVHQQRLELYAPDGSLYRRFATAFTGAGRKATSVETVVPVVGTAMSDAGLYGDWCALVFLDDDDTPVVARSFELVKPHYR
jgi:hypothetical protein